MLTLKIWRRQRSVACLFLFIDIDCNSQVLAHSLNMLYSLDMLNGIQKECFWYHHFLLVPKSLISFYLMSCTSIFI